MALHVHKFVHPKNLGGITMIKDPIVDEIRRYRQAHAKENKNDLDRIIESLRRRERDSKRNLMNPGPKLRLDKTGS